MRKLSRMFINELKSGFLSGILNEVKRDTTLCLEIRNNYINIYYRGGNLMEITETDESYNIFFNPKYLSEYKSNIQQLPKKLKDKKDVDLWLLCIPYLKYNMDLWFGKYPKEEREFQQLLIRENNFSKGAKNTDYFICDIEYANGKSRYDFIAAGWPATSARRKNNKAVTLALGEVKYMESALSGSAGIIKHLNDVDNFLSDPGNLVNLKEEMKTVFNQKLELGLINNEKFIEEFTDEKPEYIFILANHNPRSSILKRELSNLKYKNFNLKFAVSNFMGFGLYKENIYDYKDFQQRFDKQIYVK